VPTATAQVGHTRATQRRTPHGTQVRHRIPNEQNRYAADAACSGIRVANPDAPRAMPLQYLQTGRVHNHSKLCFHKLAIDLLRHDHVHERTSTTQPSRLQKFERAVREIPFGSPPIQSTYDGLGKPLNLATVRVSSLRIGLEVAGSSGFPSSRATPNEPGDRLYGRFSARSMRRVRPQMVTGTRW
jgi:hypothetical protein